MDGAATYSNDQGMTLFRNQKFWYMGSVESWPPVTYYRCVEYENCNANEVTPPVPGQWTTNKKFGKDPTPVISSTPCGGDSDEL
jgi:hypothetical protein